MTNTETRFWNIVASKDGKSATIDLHGELRAERPKNWYGEVIEGNYYTSEDFKADLAAVAGCKHVTVNINSVGGDVYVGLAIHNALKALPCKVRTVIQGVAASAASIIFCAGDEREVFNGSLLMVHGVSCLVLEAGFFNERKIDEAIRSLKSTRAALRTMNEAAAAIYASTTKKTKEECLNMISGDSETWMTGEQAIAQGFATGYTDAENQSAPLQLVACGGKTALYSGSTLLSKDFHAPLNAAELGFIMTENAPAAASANTNKHSTMDNENEKTPEAAPAPVDVAAVAAQAKKAERVRLSAIDALAEKLGGRVSKELVQVARYGNAEHEGMTPEQFAYEAVMAMEPEQPAQHETTANKAFLDARAEELAPANDVKPAAPQAAGSVDSGMPHGVEVIARINKKGRNS